MKFPLLPLFLLSLSSAIAADGVFVPTRPPVSDDELLSAIAQVETGNNPRKVGRYGERTRLQILPETWRRFSRRPQSVHDRAETDRVARAYLGFIRHRLEVRGLPQTPFYIAASWNAGPGWRHLSRGTISYAERVTNLVNVMEAGPSLSPVMVAETTHGVAPVPTLQSIVAANPAPVPVIQIAATD